MLPRAIQDRLEKTRERLEDLKYEDHISNISQDVRRAIQQLHDNRDLVIRQADKGSCTVVIDREQYVREGHQHLANEKIYQSCDKDRTLEIAHKANWAVTHHHQTGALSKYTKNQLFTDIKEVMTQRLYFLRKVHKSPHKLRPIVSASAGPTENISAHLVRLLGPHQEDIPSLVRNSLQVVNHLEGLDLGEHRGLILVTFDVESLYPSIPQGPGIEMALQRVFPTTPPTSREHLRKNMARDFLRIILGDNHFTFEEHFYTQKSGVAMGTKCAPHLANLFMASLEEKALIRWKGTPPLQWWRFLDDVLMLWDGSMEELHLFHQHLNN